MKLKLLHWNTLATRFAEQDFPKVALRDEVLPWSRRMPRILATLCDELPDVACLVEVDRPECLEVKGTYCRLFVKKNAPDSPDGALILFRVATMGLLRCVNVPLLGSQNAVVCLFVHKPTGRPLVVAATHLKAKPEFAELRTRQAELVVAAVTTMRAEADAKCAVILGDMNDEPASPALVVFGRGGFFPAHPTGGDVFTTCKWREETGLVRRTIDYILVQPAAQVSKAEIVGMKRVPEEGLPSLETPSDHLPLTATVEFLE
ncbi:MAG TPA: endonuclease/exonuclease/phosphatase family protein [Ramlibacter sp.]|nr:endonuclease/exonuclease/phosphatase family protein [Ramlibacter sp.]